MLRDALLLQLGHNATLVAVGAALLGLAAGVTGTFLFLRKRSLVSDAISHSTLPGLGLAFLLMTLAGADGRSLPGLLLGSAASAAIGLAAVHWMTTRTRLGEDAAIGAVLSVFFGLGVVLLTVIQTLPTGGQAGLEGFLLGATAGMLRAEAELIAVGAATAVAAVLVLHRPMTLAAFDPVFARSIGLNLRRIDIATLALALGVTVIGLKVVGLILIVALLVIPPVAARFWSERSGVIALVAGLIGGLSGYVGAALSATAPDLPTGPMIVLTAAAVFAVSFLFAPRRGVVAGVLRHTAYRRAVHRRQGLLALAGGQPIYERYTLRLLQRAGLARPDGVPTEAGRAEAARAVLDEARWAAARRIHAHEAAVARYDGLRPIGSVLTPDEVREIDAGIARPRPVTA